MWLSSSGCFFYHRAATRFSAMISCLGSPYLEQFIEEGAVVHNRFAQLLGVCRSMLIAHSDGLRRSTLLLQCLRSFPVTLPVLLKRSFQLSCQYPWMGGDL